MTAVYLNALSGNWQFQSVAEAESALAVIVQCFQFLLPALQHHRAELVYDDSIESRALICESPSILSALSRIPNRDLVRQWFLYVKNRARREMSEIWTMRQIGVSKPSAEILGEARSGGVFCKASWLSFGGTVLTEEVEIDIHPEHFESPARARHASEFGLFKIWWPQYQASEKHQKEGYWSAGEWVSPMPLDDVTAQIVPPTSVSDGNDRYALYQGVYFRFVLTHVDRLIFHGFRVDRPDVPNRIIDLFS